MKALILFKKFIIDNSSLVKNYKLIGVFGSSLKKNNFKDIDLFSIGDNNAHRQFLLYLKRYFKKEGYGLLFFKTIKKFPKKKNLKNILVHDLHYKTFTEYKKKEWPVIIDVISKNLLVLAGSKTNLPKIHMTKYLLYAPIYNWLNKIKTKNEFVNFKQYLVKVIPLDYKLYPQLNLKKEGNTILKILQCSNWKVAKKEVLNVLNNN